MFRASLLCVLLFSSLSAEPELTTRFFFKGTFTCQSHRAPFIQDIQAWEEDTFKPNDHIDTWHKFEIVNSTAMTYEMHAEAHGDGLWNEFETSTRHLFRSLFQNFYEISFSMRHTCFSPIDISRGMKFKQSGLILKPEAFPVIDGNLYHTEDINLERYF